MTIQTIDAVRNNILAKKTKIEEQIHYKKRTITKLRNQIQLKSDQLIDIQISGADQKDTAVLETELRSLRLELLENEDMLQSYDRKFVHSLVTEEDRQAIQVVYDQAKEEAQETIQKLSAERLQTEREIAALEKKLKQIRSDIETQSVRSVKSNFRYKLKDILPYVDERVSSLSYHELESFLETWLSGADTSRYFQKATRRPYTEVALPTNYTNPENNSNDDRTIKKEQTPVTIRFTTTRDPEAAKETWRKQNVGKNIVLFHYDRKPDNSYAIELSYLPEQGGR